MYMVPDTVGTLNAGFLGSLQIGSYKFDPYKLGFYKSVLIREVSTFQSTLSPYKSLLNYRGTSSDLGDGLE